MGAAGASWLARCSFLLLQVTAGCATHDPLDGARGCEAYGVGTCQAYARCSPMLIEAYGSVESCVSELAAGCVSSLQQPDVLGTGAAAQACGLQMYGVECTALWNSELPLGCQPPSGRRGNGAACSVGAQCASARCKKATSDAASGSCAEPALLGQDCAGFGDCARGTICGPAQQCVALAQAGQACSEAQPCRAPLYCEQGNCVAAPPEPPALPQVEQRDPLLECSSYAATLCARLDACSTFLIAGSYGSMQACVARTTQACVEDLALPDTAASALGIAGCSAALSGATCNAVFENGLPEACRLAPGARPDGAACASDSQCVSTRCAHPSAGARCGVCAPRAQAEAACVASTDCEYGLICTSDGKCRAPGLQGAACDSARPCAVPLLCGAGTCQPPLEQNMVCDPAADRCNTFAGLSCDYQSKQCRTWAASAAGQPCGYVAQSWTACTGSAKCDLNTTTWTGTCRAPAADSGGCTSTGPACVAPARCADGVCTLGSGGDCR